MPNYRKPSQYRRSAPYVGDPAPQSVILDGRGFSASLLGQPTLTLLRAFAEPGGFIATGFGLANSWNLRQYLLPVGAQTSIFGASTVFNWRTIARPAGWEASSYGAVNISHANRTLLARGSSTELYGAFAIANRNRGVAPSSIGATFASAHMVGGRRWLFPSGFVATGFGARIIPEIQLAYPQGFVGVFGQAALTNKWSVLKPQGFATTPQPADSWGTARVFNLRQFVTMEYDTESKLNPPSWSPWIAIANLDRAIATYGQSALRVSAPSIFNNARQLLPAGIDAPAYPLYYQSGMVAYRVRSLRLEGLEAPYMSTWLSVLNDGRVIAPKGYAASAFGVAVLVNTRRYYNAVGAIDSSWFGYPMVADRIRTITADPRYSIAPPIIYLPEVKQYTRYIGGIGYEAAKVGGHSLTIRFNLITPRWTLQNLYGSPIVKNLTPELRQQGRAADEYGDAHVRLQWRPVAPYDSLMQAISKPVIAFRDRTVFGQGVNAMKIGDKLVVTKTGAPPYSMQFVTLEKFKTDSTAQELGDGIPTPNFPLSQAGTPNINQQVVYVRQDDPSTGYGAHRITANSIRVEPGYGELLTGDPMVSLKRRTLVVPEWPNTLVFEPSKPRLSPHTIYAVMEATEQAKANHPSSFQPHYVDGYLRTPGAVFGYASVSLQHRVIKASPVLAPDLSRPTAANKRHYILAAGMGMLRFGWHVVPGPQTVKQFESSNHAAFGASKVAMAPYLGPVTLKMTGLNAHAAGLTAIALLNRQIYPLGYESLKAGTKLNGDSPYQWKGLRVGPLVPTMPTGFLSQAVGEPWISFRVRNLGLVGFDSFLSEYDLMNFAKRMRVIRQPLLRPSVSITPVGFAAFASAASNVRHGAHYIRPDGNADQYRKGAF